MMLPPKVSRSTIAAETGVGEGLFLFEKQSLDAIATLFFSSSR